MELKRRSKQASLLLWTAVTALLSQNLLVPVISAAANFEDQKTYYSPTDPRTGTPPSVPRSPPHHATPTPTPSYGTPPSHGGTPPSHGGSPPGNCVNPPSGGHHHPTPSPPTGGGGGYYSPPPTHTTPTPDPPTYVSPPTVVTPPTPTYVSPPTVVTPPTPTYVTPPTTPVDPGTPTTPGITIPTPPFSFPGTPGITIPSPPLPFDPNSPPFTCTYWRNHPTLVWGLLGWWGSVGNAFGVPSSLPGIGAHMNLLQALSNTRSDGLGELYREGTAALLNSMAHARFPYTTSQVRDSFVAALGSNKAAAAQARVFRMANEGKTKPRD